MTGTGTELDPNERLERLLRRIDPGARLVRAWTLSGGVSAQTTALEIERAGGRAEKLVVRRHGATDLAQNPGVAADEFRLLRILHAAGLPVPAPRYVDASGEIFGSPCIVVAFIEGATQFAPARVNDVVDQMATQFARVHAIEPGEGGLSFLPVQAERCAARLANRPASLDDEMDEGHIRDTLAPVWPLAQRNRSVLLHGDFWPGNTLWLDGQLTGIIDWEDAATGDPLADLANTRLELLLAFGFDAMHQFTQRYRALRPIDLTGLPYWDLCASLRSISGMQGWGLDDETLIAMREGLRIFIAQAFDALGENPAPCI